MSAPLLNLENLPRVAASVEGTQAVRAARGEASPGVVHLGLGAFHRAHQAMVFDSLLRQGDSRWGVFGVAMRNPQLASALQAQDGLYSVRLGDADGEQLRIVSSLWETRVAALEPQEVIQALAHPATRWVTLTVTEKGYASPLAALIVEGLARRRQASLPGLTIASCDNLANNGDLLRNLCLKEAKHDAALTAWMHDACAFPNSMVDRIVPAASASCRDQAEKDLGLRDEGALSTEVFWEWILEDRLVEATDAALLRSVGVRVVPDVKLFEEAKLWMLNGSHSALACMGAVSGLETVSDCMADSAIATFIGRLMTDELMQHVRRPEPASYRDALLARFRNPALRHSVHQIGSDFSKKIPQRWVPVIEVHLHQGECPELLAFTAAAWMRYCLGQDEAGRSYALTDPLGQQLQAVANETRDSTPQQAVQAFLGIRTIWGDEVPASHAFAGSAANWLQGIRAVGLRKALAQAVR